MAARRSRKSPKSAAAPRAARGGGATLVIVLGVIVVVLGYLGWAGLFNPVKVAQQEMGPYSLMLKEQKGNYSQTPATIEAVRESARSVGIEPDAACGIFLDNPRKVKKADLRALVGLVISPADRDKVRKLPADITYKLLPREQCLTATFPFRTRLSIWLAVMRVYPALNQAVAAAKLAEAPVVEIYKGNTITYVMPAVPAAK